MLNRTPNDIKRITEIELTTAKVIANCKEIKFIIKVIKSNQTAFSRLPKKIS